MTTSQPTGNRSRILIIDDDSYFITLVKNALQDICEVVSSTRAKQGLEMASQHPLPDLILLDIMMPGTSGYQICRELKQNPVTFGIPVIFVSGLDKVSEKVRCFELGGVDFVTKPADIEVLSARIKNHLMLKFQREMLLNLSANDPLTGLMHKRSFEQILETEWKRAERHKQAISMIICDIDDFTEYNVAFGQSQGDATILKLANVIFDTACRAGDTVARIGGDRFAVVLPNCDSVGCINVAQRLKTAVLAQEIKRPKGEASEFVTISIGIGYRVPGENSSPAVLTEMATGSLDAARAHGKNRVGVAV